MCLPHLNLLQYHLRQMDASHMVTTGIVHLMFQSQLLPQAMIQQQIFHPTVTVSHMVTTGIVHLEFQNRQLLQPNPWDKKILLLDSASPTVTIGTARLVSPNRQHRLISLPLFPLATTDRNSPLVLLPSLCHPILRRRLSSRVQPLVQPNPGYRLLFLRLGL
ncbi:hypothetical protein AJ80_03592 [Polytolypa hystricis UAMH7299]|uniref:Uncharacterized protein n=1 Tax=Polytolypa hystricis (strain UAMH7299) TaxID=1447883 RepID=A0A2B7YGC5_POLH7|nr:hypothetical protein AJ80_03592 [Polytolypa hystricis UAMH7299]